MKTTTLLLLLSATLAFGAESPANAVKPKTAACGAAEKTALNSDACPVRRSLGEGGCKEKPAAAKPDACCQAEDAFTVPAVFPSESIYQLDAKFTDDSGRAFTLGKLRGRPGVL